MKRFFRRDAVSIGWFDFFARMIDYGLFYLTISAISFLLPFYFDDIHYILLAACTPVLWIPFEAVFLTFHKRTPGGRLLGIRVETITGSSLSYKAALKRACFLGARPGILKRKVLKISRYLLAALAFSVISGVGYFERDIALMTAGFSRYATIDGWSDYTSADGGFRILFPDTPKETSTSLPVPSHGKVLDYRELTSKQTKQISYSVSYIRIPGKWRMAGASRLLQGALDLIIEHTPGSKLINKRLTMHKNYRALDFHVTQDGKEEDGRLILVGTTLYRLTVVYTPSVVNQLQTNDFLNSFEVTG